MMRNSKMERYEYVGIDDETGNTLSCIINHISELDNNEISVMKIDEIENGKYLFNGAYEEEGLTQRYIKGMVVFEKERCYVFSNSTTERQKVNTDAFYFNGDKVTRVSLGEKPTTKDFPFEKIFGKMKQIKTK